MEKDTLLRELYYSPETGYRSTEHLWQLAKEKIKNMGLDINISKNFVKEWLQKQATYTRFKKWNNPKHYRHTFVRDFDHIQMDLMETTAKEKSENENNYIFTAIEILSRTAFAYPQKSKSGVDTIKNIKQLIEDFIDRFGKKPKSIQSDEGREFTSKNVKEELESEDIVWYASKSPRKASVVERFNRTLKSKIWKMFHHQGNFEWESKLGSLIKNYNNTVHRSIGMKPVNVSEENKHIVWLRLFGHMVDIGKPKFQIGDKVRVSHFGLKNIRYREMQIGKYFRKKYEERDDAGRGKKSRKNAFN